MTTLFHDMMHQEIEVYVDDVFIKSRESLEHTTHLCKFFDRRCKINLKLNPAKCTFGLLAGKLLGFTVSRRGIELDPVKIKAIQELPPPKTKKEVMSFLRRCMLAQHDEEGKKEHAIYYLSKKFISCEARYTHMEKTCCALTWIAQKLRHYLSVFTTHLISQMDRLRYIFWQPMPIGKLAKWQMLLSELDIVYVAQKAIKGQALADLLAESPVDDELEPLRTFFPDEKVMAIEEKLLEPYSGWRLFFDGAVNYKGSSIGTVLISETSQHYPMAAKLNFRCTNNLAEYEACILGLRMALDMNIQELLVIGDFDLLINQVKGNWATKNDKILPYVNLAQRLCGRFKSIDFRHTHTPRAQNEFVDVLATIASMIQHPKSGHIDLLEITLKEEQAHCACVEAEPDGKPWYVDIKTYLEKGEYPLESSANQKKTIRRLANSFLLNKESEERGAYARAVGNGGQRNGGQIHMDLIKVPPPELHAMSASWPFVAWEMDDTGPIEPPASNGHRFILVAIDYFTKKVEAASPKSVTKKVVADFGKNNLICHFGVPESIITDNGANPNSHLMKDISEQFKITQRNSTTYRPQMNGAVEAANKNIKRILRKMVDNYKNWHEQLPYALLGYKTTTETSTGATPYLLVYCTEAVIPAEVEIPSLKIIQEAEIEDAEWVKNRYEQLAMIEEKRMVADSSKAKARAQTKERDQKDHNGNRYNNGWTYIITGGHSLVECSSSNKVESNP
ncbi:uncharacterized protein LOC132611786 [Lycium barbarum]|uniref:uncharacterized protein LOC132611786 n=1 Tax=Lycium barbarum TaxID=112863 RepID=UPI00293E50D1|nr:uncharacterized protein LOC132611786 [Lycium barbarum]